jgi:lipopolysaccharide export system protein LptC
MSPAQRAARERMMDGLRRRSPEAIALMARRSRSVTVFKAILPVTAVMILVALAVAPGLRSGPGSQRVSYRVETTANAAASRMEDAQYRGVDQHGQPFTLTAGAANQQGSDDIALSDPAGDITLASGAWLMLKSNAGLFNEKLQTLGLSGDVTLYRNDGTMMTGPDARIDLKGGGATSSSPVQAAGPFGTLNAAGGFVLSDRGADVLFNGPVTMVLNQVEPAPAPQPSGAATR